MRLLAMCFYFFTHTQEAVCEMILHNLQYIIIRMGINANALVRLCNNGYIKYEEDKQD